MTLPSPLWTAQALAQAAGRSSRWIRQIAWELELGQYQGNRCVYTAAEAERILHLIREAAPGRGRPRQRQPG